jgi:hypothetical protein
MALDLSQALHGNSAMYDLLIQLLTDTMCCNTNAWHHEGCTPQPPLDLHANP